MRPPEPSFVVARDGTSLAYWKSGSGPTLVYTNGFATSDFYWTHLLRGFASQTQQITWDLKGHGRSGPAHDLGSCGIPDSVDDLIRVMDAAEIDQAVLIGFSLGCQIILEACREHPDRIQAVIPILGTYGRPFETLFHPRVGGPAFEFFRRTAPRTGSLTMQMAHRLATTRLAHPLNQMLGMVGKNVRRREMLPFYEHFAEIDGATWAAMGIGAQNHSARDLLPHIDVPALIIAGGRDLLTPNHLSVEMADNIPNAELLYLPDATHCGLFEEPLRIETEIQRFLKTNSIL